MSPKSNYRKLGVREVLRECTPSLPPFLPPLRVKGFGPAMNESPTPENTSHLEDVNGRGWHRGNKKKERERIRRGGCVSRPQVISRSLEKTWQTNKAISGMDSVISHFRYNNSMANPPHLRCHVWFLP